MRRRRLGAFVVTLLAVVAVIAVGWGPALGALGWYLVVDEPLRRAEAIMVLNGGLPYREQEAAALYRDGWAPKVILVRGAAFQGLTAARALGAPVPDEPEIRRVVLVHLGVKPEDIVVSTEHATTTLDELRVAARLLGEDGTDPVILVTSKAHSRRSALTWAYVTGGRRPALTQSAPEDFFDPARWWTQKGGPAQVAHEYLGLVNVWLSFPFGEGS